MDLSGIGGVLVGIHGMLANMTATPELAIDISEGQSLANAAGNVMRHYGVKTTQKAVDWFALFGVLGGVYATRAVAIGNRKRMEKKTPPIANADMQPSFWGDATPAPLKVVQPIG